MQLAFLHREKELRIPDTTEIEPDSPRAVR